MGLTDDQKAMLRLLAQREEGYDDMAALMGISVEEVRERVKEALAEVEEPRVGAERPKDEEPTPVPEPAPPAPAPDEPQTSAAPPQEPAAEPLEPAPVQKPRPAPTPVPEAKPGAVGQRTHIPSLKLPKDRGALIGIGAGLAVILVLVLILVLGGDGDGGGQSESSAASGEGAPTENVSAAAREKDLTQAVLSPSNGGDAAGRAIFGRFEKKVLLQVTAENLEPSGQGQMYTVWLYRSPKIALQIGGTPVDDSGKLAAQFEIPVQLLTYVANGAFDQIDIALTDTAEYKAAFTKAKRENKVPPYVGESVLRGPITSPAIKQQR